MDYYQKQQQKAEEMITCWLWAMPICFVLAAAWGIVEYLKG